MTSLKAQAVFPGRDVQPSPLDDVWVALDLETTGLDPESDEIIEVGAVKFQGEKVLDTFRSFVNPGRSLSGFITGVHRHQPAGRGRGPFVLIRWERAVGPHRIGARGWP